MGLRAVIYSDINSLVTDNVVGFSTLIGSMDDGLSIVRSTRESALRSSSERMIPLFNSKVLVGARVHLINNDFAWSAVKRFIRRGTIVSIEKVNGEKSTVSTAKVTEIIRGNAWLG